MMRVIRKLCVLGGTLLIIETLLLLTLINFNTGIVAAIVFGGAYVIYGLYAERLKNFIQHHLWRKIVYYGAHVINIVFIVVMIFISIVGKWDTATYKEDALIVLGAGLRGDVITWPLYYRLEKAVNYAQRNPQAVIVVSGGQGYGESVTEASAMKRFLLSHGVAEKRIITEEKSTSTYENFVYSKRLLDQHFGQQTYTTVYVTNSFHIFRAGQLARLAHLPSNHLHAKIQWYIIPVNYIREVLAIGKLIVLKQ